MLLLEYSPSSILTVANSLSAIAFNLRIFIVSGILIVYELSDVFTISSWSIPSALIDAKLLSFDALIIVIS